VAELVAAIWWSEAVVFPSAPTEDYHLRSRRDHRY